MNAEQKINRPNVLLIMVDQWRGDSLSYMGHEQVETPYLDTLASGGVSFDSAYSAVPTCIAARSAFFTGLTQANHGRVGYEEHVSWKQYPQMMAEEFGKAGYHTQAVGKMHVYPSRYRCGFDDVRLHDGFLHSQRAHNAKHNEHSDYVDDYIPWLKSELGNRVDLMDMGLDCNSFIGHPWNYPEYTHPTNWVTEESIDFLRRRDPTEPFFLFASYHRPHAPYDPPQSYFDMYRDVEVPDPPVGDWEPEDDAGEGWNAITYAGEVRPHQFKRAKRAYWASMTHIDHQIGRLLSELGDAGVAGNTVVLFVSDHGDLLGDHRRWRKSSPLEGASRIPFIINDPTGRLGLKRGHVSKQLVELRDVLPTLLEACHIDIPSTVDGHSVLPYIKQDPKPDEIREYLHGEHRMMHYSYHMIRHTNGMKYAWFDQTGEELLFDLREDPQELHNLMEEAKADGSPYHEELSRLRSYLIEELKDREEGFVQDGQLIVGRPGVSSLKNSYLAK